MAWLLGAGTALAGPKEIIVAANGSGRFRTMQAAIAAVPEEGLFRTIIPIRPGEYHGQIVVPKEKSWWKITPNPDVAAGRFKHKIGGRRFCLPVGPAISSRFKWGTTTVARCWMRHVAGARFPESETKVVKFATWFSTEESWSTLIGATGANT